MSPKSLPSISVLLVVPWCNAWDFTFSECIQTCSRNIGRAFRRASFDTKDVFDRLLGKTDWLISFTLNSHGAVTLTGEEFHTSSNLEESEYIYLAPRDDRVRRGALL